MGWIPLENAKKKKKLHIVQIENIKNQNYVNKIYMNEYTSLFLCPHKVHFYVYKNTELIGSYRYKKSQRFKKKSEMLPKILP